MWYSTHWSQSDSFVCMFVIENSVLIQTCLDVILCVQLLFKFISSGVITIDILVYHYHQYLLEWIIPLVMALQYWNRPNRPTLIVHDPSMFNSTSISIMLSPMMDNIIHQSSSTNSSSSSSNLTSSLVCSNMALSCSTKKYNSIQYSSITSNCTITRYHSCSDVAEKYQ